MYILTLFVRLWGLVDMAIEIFLVPMESVPHSDFPAHTEVRGKHTDLSLDPGMVRSGTLRYSNGSHGVAMIEADQTYLDTVAADPDVTRLATSQNLDEVLTAGQANAVKTIFEGAFIPGQFINAGDTRRQVIRGLVGMFLFSQRMSGRLGDGWKERAQARGMTLDSTWAEFPVALQSELIDVRNSFGWTNVDLGVNASSTMRDILQAVSQRFENAPIVICGVEV